MGRVSRPEPQQTLVHWDQMSVALNYILKLLIKQDYRHIRIEHYTWQKHQVYTKLQVRKSIFTHIILTTCEIQTPGTVLILHKTK